MPTTLRCCAKNRRTFERRARIAYVVIALGKDVFGWPEELVEVADIALEENGFLARPARLSREKFCMVARRFG